VGHLTYHTGEYGGFGEFFDAVTDLSLDIINENPPLGRKLVPIHQDIGTHGGAIEAEFGGTGKEPLFRGSPMDSAQGAAALLHAKNAGKNSVVLVATEAAGSQLQKNAAEKAAGKLGLEVLGSVDIQPNQSNYRSVVSKVASMEPEAVVVFSAPADGGAFVKNAAESGNSWFIVGTSEWQEPGFISTATMQAVEKHQEVVLAAFSNADSPAWESFKPRAEGSEYAEAIGDVSNSYAIQYFDLLVATALAIEKTGSVEAESWAGAMYEVTGGDGEVVHTYNDGIEAIRAGKDINYDGVTGTMEYTDTGVVAGIFGIFKWVSEDDLEQVALADGKEVLDLDQ